MRPSGWYGAGTVTKTPYHSSVPHRHIQKGVTPINLVEFTSNQHGIICINPYAVVAVYADTIGTRIVTNGGETYLVRESVDEVTEVLEGAT